MDHDLDTLDRDALVAEVKRLRAGIREHRDSSEHELCRHHPQLWGLLPEPIAPEVPCGAPVVEGTTTSASFEDPFGNRLQICSRGGTFDPA
jgi:hypothetical protein